MFRSALLVFMSFAAVSCLGASCVAQEDPCGVPVPDRLFCDDFNDGNAEDGVPVNWVPSPTSPSGTREVIDGDYVLTPASEREMDSDADSLLFDHVSVRTKFRSDGASWVGLYARSSYVAGPRGQSIWGFVTQDGGLRIGRSFDTTASILGRTETGWDVTQQDIHLQLDALGNDLSLTAWLDGTEKPAIPQLTTDLSGFEGLVAGRIGLAVIPMSAGFKPIPFRFVEAVPEPASALLAGLGLLGLTLWRRRRSSSSAKSVATRPRACQHGGL